MGKFDDEKFLGLPAAEIELDTLWDVPPSNKKYTKTWPANIDAEMYQVLQTLANHPALPFQGNNSALARHALASLIDSLRSHLEGGIDTMWNRVYLQQRQLTNERYALHINEILDKQVALLREWTLSGEWQAVLQDLTLAAEAIDKYPNPWWKRRAAQGWLSHEGVRGLRIIWERRMVEESTESWIAIRRVFARWEEMVGN